MTIFNVGRATIARVEEVYGPTYPATHIFPELSPDILDLHAPWLAPHHYEAETGLIKLSVHSWLLQIGGQKILIDACCGRLTVVTPTRKIVSEEGLLLVGLERHHAELSHSPTSDHAARQMGGLDEVVLRARGDVTESDLLGRAAAQHYGQTLTFFDPA